MAKRLLKSICVYTLVLLIFPMQWAHAALEIELTKGVESAIPLAIMPFAWESKNAEPPVNIAQVISADLSHSGQFKVVDVKARHQAIIEPQQVNFDYWLKQHVDNMVIGKIQPMSSGQYKVEFSLLDLYKGKQAAEEQQQKALAVPTSPVIATQSFVVDSKSLRHVAHQISDLIYQQLTGQRGIFTTKLAYVTVTHQDNGVPVYLLQVSDIDGNNAKPILRSPEPIMSPSWSPNGKFIAYVSFEGKRPRIYVSEVATGKRELITSYPGINGAPAWSPNGKTLAVALSKGKNPNLFLINLADKRLQQITKDWAINTEPAWAPDGKSLIFTSDRGGSPQIYEYTFGSGEIERLTFDGKYNSSASFTPDGQRLVLLHRGHNRWFNVAVLDLSTGVLKELTQTGMDESPSVAPNGKMIVYASYYGGKGILGMVSTDGRIKLRLPDQHGAVQEPVWSPFLNG